MLTFTFMVLLMKSHLSNCRTCSDNFWTQICDPMFIFCYIQPTPLASFRSVPALCHLHHQWPCVLYFWTKLVLGTLTKGKTKDKALWCIIRKLISGSHDPLTSNTDFLFLSHPIREAFCSFVSIPKDIMRDLVKKKKILLRSTFSIAFLWCAKLVTLSKKKIRLVSSDLFLVTPWWVLLISAFPQACPSIHYLNVPF